MKYIANLGANSGHHMPQDKTRQDKRATAVEGNPKAPFSLASTVTYGINRNSRQGGAPLLSRCVHATCPGYYYFTCFLQNHMLSPLSLPPKKPNDHCLQMGTQTDTHLFHGVHFDRGCCKWVPTIDPHDS